ncbi:hypothetical protein T484DRAFT_1790833 [Baffinella frigidus]|nr:hypothetical protein T484DRAFT_1790833 [Cryptophyta sp. CCMP2293]
MDLIWRPNCEEYPALPALPVVLPTRETPPWRSGECSCDGGCGAAEDELRTPAVARVKEVAPGRVGPVLGGPLGGGTGVSLLEDEPARPEALWGGDVSGSGDESSSLGIIAQRKCEMVAKIAVGKKRRAEEEEAAAMPAEEDSDGGEDSDGDDGGGLAGFAGNGAAEPAEDKATARDALWADPTHDEMQGLRETELLFKSSLMRLQV